MELIKMAVGKIEFRHHGFDMPPSHLERFHQKITALTDDRAIECRQGVGLAFCQRGWNQKKTAGFFMHHDKKWDYLFTYFCGTAFEKILIGLSQPRTFRAGATMSDQNYNTYTIKLPQFEGPFDLLLFFIERDELDINNIPIAKITDDFLEYIRHIESLNIDLASEFIVVAATLMRIKAKMLLPRKAVDEEGNEIDPREELVQKLLEYKRYKETLDTFRRWEEERANMFGRGIAKDELKKIAELAMVDAELESITLFKLLKAFENVMDQLKDRKVVAHTIARYAYTIQEQQHYLLNRIQAGEQTSFEAVFLVLESRIHAIVTFLALLELLSQQKIHLIQGEGINNFWLTLPEEGDDSDQEAPEEDITPQYSGTIYEEEE